MAAEEESSSKVNKVKQLPNFYTECDVLNTPLPFRFVRLNPRFDEQETLLKLKTEVNCDPYPVPVPWLDGFYALPGHFSLQQSASFQLARIYGQDVSSGAAVAALMTDAHDCHRLQPASPPLTTTTMPNEAPPLRVLDLCCCPGLKLCAIADSILKRREQRGVVVGVDVSEQRMAVCKRVVCKYQIQKSTTMTRVEEGSAKDGTTTCIETANNVDKNIKNVCAEDPSVRIRLYCNDGTALATLQPADLNLVFDSVIANEDDAVRLGKRKRMNKSARARENRRLKEMVALDAEPCSADHAIIESSGDDGGVGVHWQLFDRVLVDAECSTDGSVVHIQKRFAKAQQHRGGDDQQQQHIKTSQWTSDEQLSKLVALQRKLAATGFRLLRRGGHMVYSTCSLSEDQNEGVVRWLMTEFPDARIVPVDFSAGGTTDSSELKRPGTINGTVQFFPNLGRNAVHVDRARLYGGGFFLAKIVKT